MQDRVYVTVASFYKWHYTWKTDMYSHQIGILWLYVTPQFADDIAWHILPIFEGIYWLVKSSYDTISESTAIMLYQRIYAREKLVHLR